MKSSEWRSRSVRSCSWRASTDGPHESACVHVADCQYGFGLHAAAHIPKHAPIIVFSGRVVSLGEVLTNGRDECYPLQIGRWTYLDLEGPCRFANHSCCPNAGLRADRILTALRDIALGEEICFDYSTTMSERRWTMQCECGAPDCRGTIGDFHDVPMTLQQEYLALGIVQSFIVEEFWWQVRK